jgi:peptidyl-prolyl cis-trans isomerase D
MLNQLRSVASGIGSKILLVLLVLSFAVWGIGDMVSGPGRNREVATVGDEAIPLAAFQQAFRQEVENIRRSLGDNYSPELVKNLNVSDYVLHRLINRKLLQMESEALGLLPGDADIARRIRSNPAFQNDKGEFDKRAFETMLRNIGLSEQGYVNEMRQELGVSLIVDTLTAAVPVPEIAASTLYQALEEQRTADIYTLSPSLVSVPAPDDATITAYYNENGQTFSSPEYRTLTYASIKANDVRDRATVSEDDLRAAYQEHLEEYKRPERRAVEQLLFSSEEKARAAYKKLQEGASFKQLAKSGDILNKNAVSLGKVEREKIFDEAAQPVFSLKAGEFTEPLKSAFGWHIFHVTAIEPPSTLPFEEVRASLEKELAVRSGEEALSKFTNHVEDALAGGSTLQEIAREMSMTLQTVGPVSAQGETPEGRAAKLPELDKFLETAFKTDEKTESPLTISRNGLYYIVRVDSVTPEHVRPLSEVRSQVIARWQNEERAKRLAGLAGDIAAKMANSATRGQVMDQYGLTVTPSGPLKRSSTKAAGLTLSPELLNEIFSRRPGQSTAAYPAPGGDYMVAVVRNIVPAASGSNGKLAELSQGLHGSVQNEIITQYLTYLGKKYGMTINRSLIEQAADQ